MCGNPATVLIIESHPMMRAALCAAIADESDLMIGAIAADGADVLQMAETLQPDLILFSLDNPDADELKALKSLHEKLPSASILALTSNEVEGQSQAALENGAHSVLTKAAPRAELIRTLRELQTKTLIHHLEENIKKGADQTIAK